MKPFLLATFLATFFAALLLGSAWPNTSFTANVLTTSDGGGSIPSNSSFSTRATTNSDVGEQVAQKLSVRQQGKTIQHVVFPQDAGIYNVKTEFGAKGDGVTDDTVAIQTAFQSTQKRAAILYFPVGTYLISNPVWFRGFMLMQGESTDKTIIRLKDYAPNYQDKAHPNWLMGTTEPGSPEGRSGDNMAFSNYMLNLTLDTGIGNPGAIAIQFISNNGGGLEDVTIHSGDGSGLMGLDLRTPWNGPSLFKNVQISGFDYGIVSWNETYFSTFESISLKNQRLAGWVNYDHPLVVRKLTSEQNNVPAIINTTKIGRAAGHFVILDSELRNSGSKGSAIANQMGEIFVRNLKTIGYQTALQDRGKVFTNPVVQEYSSGEAISQFPSLPKTLSLPIQETPTLPWEALQNWVSVKQFAHKVTPDGDWAPAIQAAIDSGKSTVYFPKDGYLIRSTVRVRGGVRVMQGLGSGLYADGKALNGKPVFRIESGKPAIVFLDRFSFEVKENTPSSLSIEDRSSRKLVVLHSRYLSYRNTPTAGALFVDDMVGGPWHFKYPQKVWLRGLNVELGQQTKVVNDAATLWVLGWKSEGRATELKNGAQARTEILGGLIYPASGNPDQYPTFINWGGRLSLVHAMFWANHTYIEDHWKGKRRTLRMAPGTRFMPLYVTNPPN